MNKDKIIQTVTHILKSELTDDYKIVLFGSWIKGDALPTADLDFGIIGKRPLSWEKYLLLKRQIDNIPTLRGIDLVDFNRVSDHFKQNALTHAKYL